MYPKSYWKVQEPQIMRAFKENESIVLDLCTFMQLQNLDVRLITWNKLCNSHNLFCVIRKKLYFCSRKNSDSYAKS